MTLTPSLFNDAEQFLCSIDSDWAKHIQRIGPCLHTALPAREPYQALAHAVAHQQLHAKAANAILQRLLALYPDATFPTPAQLASTSDESLRACGFSANKILCLHGIAQAALEGEIPQRQEALAMTDDALIERLTRLRGVGRWTVEMLQIYCLERLDILPADDFGVREGYRRLKGLEKSPTPKQIKELGRHWSPYRTIASWYLGRVPAP